MQLVLSNNRIVAHGENFISMGGTVINKVTGAKHENATIAECDGGCPSDIDEVGYEYHAGVFKPCAPFGKGNNNGYFMEVCESCATPRSSGIPIKKGIKLENLHSEVSAESLGAFDDVLLWENADTTAEFESQTINLDLSEYQRIKIIVLGGTYSHMEYYSTWEITEKGKSFALFSPYAPSGVQTGADVRSCKVTDTGVAFGSGKSFQSDNNKNFACIPYKIIGYKHL
ncbi:MAG: hypothetical protein E7398_00315 [Ruminococcaceae bacterium]|nr:hypothetical protein [Oscillospiraceae bacterium]